MSLRLGGPVHQSYAASVASLFAWQTDQPRRQLAKAVALRSVRLKLADVGKRGRRSGTASGLRTGDEEQLDGFHEGTVPLRVRPAFIVLNIVTLVFLGILGFHPRGQAFVPFNDKVMHFVCFFLATGLFYCIWDVDEPARRIWIWRHMPLLLTWFTCFAAGGIGSEIVQSLLPYKTFQWGDVLANFAGSGLGLFVSYHAERRYRVRREIERLYEPLDQDLYGDEDEEDGDEDFLSAYNGRRMGRRDDPSAEDADDPWRSTGTGNKSDEVGPQPPGAPSASKADTATAATRIGNLFSLSGEDDDDNGGQGTAADVWREAR